MPQTQKMVGMFIADPSGLMHYRFELGAGHVSTALEDALANRPKNRASWFWFNGTPAPIYPEDTMQTLHRRWSEWRDSYQTEHGSLLDRLAAIAKAR